MNMTPQTALIRRQVLSNHAMKRALRGTSALTSTHTRISVDAPSASVQATIENNRAAAKALKAREPIMVFLSNDELKLCPTWEEMKAVLGLKGVPDDRLDGSPDVRADEREDGLMLEIL